jgi:hypothetical protein
MEEMMRKCHVIQQQRCQSELDMIEDRDVTKKTNNPDNDEDHWNHGCDRHHHGSTNTKTKDDDMNKNKNHHHIHQYNHRDCQSLLYVAAASTSIPLQFQSMDDEDKEEEEFEGDERLAEQQHKQEDRWQAEATNQHHRSSMTHSFQNHFDRMDMDTPPLQPLRMPTHHQKPLQRHREHDHSRHVSQHYHASRHQQQTQSTSSSSPNLPESPTLSSPFVLAGAA